MVPSTWVARSPSPSTRSVRFRVPGTVGASSTRKMPGSETPSIEKDSGAAPSETRSMVARPPRMGSKLSMRVTWAATATDSPTTSGGTSRNSSVWLVQWVKAVASSKCP